jgi:hypothetical protein
MENRIWDDRIRNLSVWCRRFEAFVRCDPGSLWLVIIPKSRHWFMEWPHTMPGHTHIVSWVYWSKSKPFHTINTGNSFARTTGRCPPPLGHYKKRRTLPSSTTPPSALLPRSPRLSITLTKCHSRHQVTTTHLRLGWGPKLNPNELLVLPVQSRQAAMARSGYRLSSDELLRSAMEAGPRWTGAPVVHDPWTKLTELLVQK